MQLWIIEIESNGTKYKKKHRLFKVRNLTKFKFNPQMYLYTYKGSFFKKILFCIVK